MIAGLVWLIAAVGDAGSTVTTWELAPPLLPTGLGIGLLVAPVFDIVLAGVEEHEVGSASGVLNAVQQLAGALGVAVLGTIFFSVVADHGFATALQRTLWIDAGVMVCVLLVSPLLPRRAREEEPQATTAPSVNAQPV